MMQIHSKTDRSSTTNKNSLGLDYGVYVAVMTTFPVGVIFL